VKKEWEFIHKVNQYAGDDMQYIRSNNFVDVAIHKRVGEEVINKVKNDFYSFGFEMEIRESDKVIRMLLKWK
ncbi:hypothetical protein ACT17C_19540, partial [Bacillus subtilis]